MVTNSIQRSNDHRLFGVIKALAIQHYEGLHIPFNQDTYRILLSKVPAKGAESIQYTIEQLEAKVRIHNDIADSKLKAVKAIQYSNFWSRADSFKIVSLDKRIIYQVIEKYPGYSTLEIIQHLKNEKSL